LINSQPIWWHICKTAQAHAKATFCKRATKPTHQDRVTWTDNNTAEKKHEPVTRVWQKWRFSADTFVVNQSLVLRINICGENRHLRQARKRYAQLIGRPK
jgi:hypothetical protein